MPRLPLESILCVQPSSPITLVSDAVDYGPARGVQEGRYIPAQFLFNIFCRSGSFLAVFVILGSSFQFVAWFELKCMRLFLTFFAKPGERVNRPKAKIIHVHSVPPLLQLIGRRQSRRPHKLPRQPTKAKAGTPATSRAVQCLPPAGVLGLRFGGEPPLPVALVDLADVVVRAAWDVVDVLPCIVADVALDASVTRIALIGDGTRLRRRRGQGDPPKATVAGLSVRRQEIPLALADVPGGADT